MNDALTSVETAAHDAVALLTAYGLSVLGAFVILIVGLWISGRAQHLIAHALERTGRIEAILIGFFSNLVKYGILVFTVLAVLNQFGVQTASLLTVIGAAGLAIGLAMQGTLSNIAAGVMLLIFRPFHAGNKIEVAGNTGTVRVLNLFFTEMATDDNIKLIVPNGQIWGATLKNYSASATRRVDLGVGVPFTADLDKALAAVRQAVEAEKRVLPAPEAAINTTAITQSAITITVEAWVASGDYGDVKNSFIKAIKESLDAAGIGLALPAQQVFVAERKSEEK
jgi:small conductance mechanosensitive channel